MPLTPSEAADVAKRHGLSLQDAAGLLSLATDAADAETIAARFAAPATEAATRALAARLFGRSESTTPDDEPAVDAAHQYARDLFRTTD